MNVKTDWVEGSFKGFLLFVIGTCFLWLPSFAGAQAVIPPAGKSGIIEKDIKKSKPKFRPPQEKIPQITIEDSRKLKDAGAGPTFKVRRIEIEGNTLIDDETLAPLVDIGEETEMTLGVLALIANDVTAFYAKKGYFLTRAYIPEQEVADGVVVMKVVEGRLDKIEVRGNQRIATEDILNRIQRVRDEKVLREQTLERVLLELNDLLGVQVQSVLKPGSLPGTSDLILDVKETRPYTVSFDGDNFGSRFTGRNRFGFTGTVGSVLVFGDQFSVRGVKSDEDQNFIQPTYLIPINRYGTTIQGTFTYSDHELGDVLSALNGGGSSTIYELEISHPVHRSRTARIVVSGGAEFRNFENDALGVTTSDDDLYDLFVSIGGDFSDSLRGRTFFELRTQFGYTEDNPNHLLNSRFKGRGDITVATLDVTRYQSAVVFNSYFIMQAQGQVVSGRALSPDLFTVGGVGSVRGYPLSEIAGDHGYNFSLEYVVPFPAAWPVPFLPASMTLDRVFSVFGFIDHGRIFVLRRQVGEEGQSLSGGGGGVKINIPKTNDNLAPSVSFVFTYAIPVLGSPDPSDTSYGTAYAGGVITF